MDFSDVAAHMEIGMPLTFEEMQRERQTSEQCTPREELSGETNPYVFDDKPVNHNNFAAISVVDDSLSQKHVSSATLLKIRGAFATLDDLKTAVVPNENCDLFACELYKFSILPCTADIISMDSDTRDGVMNDCLRMYENMRIASADDFDARKRKMMDDIKRQEDIKERVRQGELPESAIESASVCPEELPEAAQPDEGAHMLSDAPLSDFKFATVAMISIKEITDADPDGNKYNVPDCMRGKTIFKIAGTFRTQEEASTHAEKLRKQRKYKHIDLYVVHMYEWLFCPPNVELLPCVQYAQDKLTEAIGTLKDEVTASEMMQDMIEADGQLV